MKEKLKKKLKKIIRPFIRPFWAKIRPYYSRIVNHRRYLESKPMAIVLEKELKLKLKKGKFEGIIVFETFFGYNMKMFQRPQHIAINLAKKNFLYFYKSSPFVDKEVTTYIEEKPGLYVVNTDIYWVHEVIMKVISESKLPKFVHVYSTSYMEYDKYLTNYFKQDFRFIYEFVDDFSDKIAGFKIPREVFESHKKMLEMKDKVFVVSTANKLFEEVKEIRGITNSIIATNGVQFEHFALNVNGNINVNSNINADSQNLQIEIQLNDAMKNAINKNKPIIGYFGAMAEWFDYELIKKIATKRPDWEVVLIGVDYDGSIEKSGLSKFVNVNYIGPVNYLELPAYSRHFSVSTIPFILNDITESTSPVKLFEYMAMGHPIVTTDLPECRKYKSALISKTHEDFIINLDHAMLLIGDSEYSNTLRVEGLSNTWDKKAQAIKELILYGNNKSN